MIFFNTKNLKERAEKKKIKYINKRVKHYKKLALSELKRQVNRGKMIAEIRIDDSLYNDEIISNLLEHFQKSDRYHDVSFSMDQILTENLVMKIKDNK